MKFKLSSLALINALAAISAALLASPAFANQSAFAFTMEHRYVSGEKNKVSHEMDSGTLTVSGELWASHCNDEAVPELVRFSVVTEDALGDSPICSFAVLPEKAIGKKTPFNATCDKISRTDIYIVAYQVNDDDGCTVQATGKLTTQ